MKKSTMTVLLICVLLVSVTGGAIAIMLTKVETADDADVFQQEEIGVGSTDCEAEAPAEPEPEPEVEPEAEAPSEPEVEAPSTPEVFESDNVTVAVNLSTVLTEDQIAAVKDFAYGNHFIKSVQEIYKFSEPIVFDSVNIDERWGYTRLEFGVRNTDVEFVFELTDTLELHDTYFNSTIDDNITPIIFDNGMPENAMDIYLAATRQPIPERDILRTDYTGGDIVTVRSFYDDGTGVLLNDPTTLVSENGWYEMRNPEMAADGDAERILEAITNAPNIGENGFTFTLEEVDDNYYYFTISPFRSPWKVDRATFTSIEQWER